MYKALAQQTTCVEWEPKFQAPAPTIWKYLIPAAAIQNSLGSVSTALPANLPRSRVRTYQHLEKELIVSKGIRKCAYQRLKSLTRLMHAFCCMQIHDSEQIQSKKLAYQSLARNGCYIHLLWCLNSLLLCHHDRHSRKLHKRLLGLTQGSGKKQRLVPWRCPVSVQDKQSQCATQNFQHSKWRFNKHDH